MKGLDFSLILPCYNEGSTFEGSVNKIVNSLKGYKYEIIFVEDKSLDDTRIKVEKLVKKLKGVKAIYHKKNMGRGKSVSDGILASSANVCGYIDVDCEISPRYIPLFIKEVRLGSDLVVGERFYEKGVKSIGRVVASKVYSSLVRILLKLPVKDTESGYKFFNKHETVKVLKKARDYKWFWDTEICARAHYAGLNISQIPVLFVRRPEKKSTVKLIPDSIEYFLKLMSFRSQLSKSK